MSTLSNVINQVTNTTSPTLTQLGIGTTAATTTVATSNASTTSAAATAAATNNVASTQLAGNFDTFLQLLTTQLQNQDPLDPLDTNEFTQQLVEFASVEQQVNTNTNLQTLITLQQTSEATSALQLVGSTVTVSGNSATLSNATNSPATWNMTASGPATANVTITSSTGQTAVSGSLALNAGSQSFTWSGMGSNGVTWPDGVYTIAVNATSANGGAVTVSTQTQGVVTGVNLNQNPPQILVGGQSVPISNIQSISH